jgi:MFS family permease
MNWLSRQHARWLYVILLIAFLGWQVTRNLNISYRTDDLATLAVVEKSFPDMMDNLANQDVHPPLFFVLLQAWTQLFGPAVDRTLVALFYLLSCAAIGYFAHKFFGEEAGWQAAILFAVSPLGWVTLGILRMYTLAIFLAAVATGLLTKQIRERLSIQNALLYGLCVMLGSFTHVWFFFLLIGHGVAVLAFCHPSGWWRWATVWLMALLPYATLWLPGFLRQMDSAKDQAAWLTIPEIVDLPLTLVLLVGVGAMWLMPILGGFLTKEFRVPKLAWVSVLVAVTTLIVPFAASFSKPIFYSRFTVVAIPAFCFALIGLCPDNWRRPVAFLTMFAGFWMAANTPAQDPVCHPQKIAAFLAQKLTDQDAVIFTSLSRRAPSFYLGKSSNGHLTSFPASIDLHPNYEGDLYSKQQHWHQIESQAGQLVEKLHQEMRLRIFVTGGQHDRVDEILAKALDKNYQKVESATTPQCSSTGDHMKWMHEYRLRK